MLKSGVIQVHLTLEQMGLNCLGPPVCRFLSVSWNKCIPFLIILTFSFLWLYCKIAVYNNVTYKICAHQLSMLMLSVTLPVNRLLRFEGVKSHMWIFDCAGDWHTESPCYSRVKCTCFQTAAYKINTNTTDVTCPSPQSNLHFLVPTSKTVLFPYVYSRNIWYCFAYFI